MASSKSARDSVSSAIEVIDTLMRVMYSIRRGQSMRNGEHDLSGPRSRVLAAIAETRPVRMGDLAGRLGITARTITTLVDALEQEGFIVRLADPTDRRATLLDLTPSGWHSYAQIGGGLVELAEQIVSPLSTEERDQLLKLLSRLQLPGVVINCEPGESC